MSEFYLGFWWSFPAFIVGVLIGWDFAKSKSKKKGEAENGSLGEAIILALAILGGIALFSGYPVFEAFRLSNV